MQFQHGHIYFVEFDPSTGHEFKKIRPAVVISSNELIRRSNLVTCIPLTGNNENMVEGDIMVKRTIQNKLFMDSILKSQHVSTFDKSRIKKHIGELEEHHLEKLKEYIAKNFLIKM